MSDRAAIRNHEPQRRFGELFAAELIRAIRRDNYDTWFRDLSIESLAETEVVLGVPSGFVRDWLTRHYLPTLRRAAETAGGRRLLVKLQVVEAPARPRSDGDARRRAQVDGVLDALADDPPPLTSYEAEQRRKDLQPDALVNGQGAAPASSARDSIPEFLNCGARVPGHLNQLYTFESFVVGPCNRLGHAAALAIGENPGRAYNPLFLHGSVGLGKTHLLQAICHTVQRRRPVTRFAFLSCEEFTNQFIQAIQAGKLDTFRQYFRLVDVLLIDDVQFLANKDRTQEEFFHTFNALYNNHKQVVISSDCPPFEIPTLEERLVSRFKWGLVAELEMPCYETRVAIVQRKARLRGTELGDDIAHFIAETIDTNIRELEGAVVRLLGVAALTERPITLELAQEALADIARPRTRRVSMDGVLSLIAHEFSLTARDITGKSRVHHISLTRQVGMYLSRIHTDHSLEEIGRFFGNRDHTTVLYAVSKIKNRSASDPTFKSLLDRLSLRMLNGLGRSPRS